MIFSLSSPELSRFALVPLAPPLLLLLRHHLCNCSVAVLRFSRTFRGSAIERAQFFSISSDIRLLGLGRISASRSTVRRIFVASRVGGRAAGYNPLADDIRGSACCRHGRSLSNILTSLLCVKPLLLRSIKLISLLMPISSNRVILVSNLIEALLLFVATSVAVSLEGESTPRTTEGTARAFSASWRIFASSLYDDAVTSGVSRGIMSSMFATQITLWSRYKLRIVISAPSGFPRSVQDR